MNNNSNYYNDPRNNGNGNGYQGAPVRMPPQGMAVPPSPQNPRPQARYANGNGQPNGHTQYPPPPHPNMMSNNRGGYAVVPPSPGQQRGRFVTPPTGRYATPPSNRGSTPLSNRGGATPLSNNRGGVPPPPYSQQGGPQYQQQMQQQQQMQRQMQMQQQHQNNSTRSSRTRYADPTNASTRSSRSVPVDPSNGSTRSSRSVPVDISSRSSRPVPTGSPPSPKNSESTASTGKTTSTTSTASSTSNNNNNNRDPNSSSVSSKQTRFEIPPLPGLEDDDDHDESHNYDHEPTERSTYSTASRMSGQGKVVERAAANGNAGAAAAIERSNSNSRLVSFSGYDDITESTWSDENYKIVEQKAPPSPMIKVKRKRSTKMRKIGKESNHSTNSGSGSHRELGHLMRTMGHREGSEDSEDEEARGNRDETEVTITTTAQKLREAETRFASEIFNMNSLPAHNFHEWCLFIFLAHTAQTMFLFVIAAKNRRGWNWYSSYADPHHPGLEPSPNEIGHLSVLWLIPFIPMLDSLEHICCLTFPQTYAWYMERSQNPFRWTAYTLSAALMRVVIAQQVGLNEVHMLMTLFVLMMFVIQGGATHETMNAKARSEDRPQNWRCFFLALPTWLLGWAILFNYFRHFEQDGGAPVEVWFIMMSLFLADLTFPIIFVLQWTKCGPFHDYVLGEKAFLIMGFLSKTALCWLSVANITDFFDPEKP